MIRKRRTFAVLGFDSTHLALDAEALLHEARLAPVPVPAPSGLTANCGIALRLELDAAEEAVSCLERAGIHVARMDMMEDL